MMRLANGLNLCNPKRFQGNYFGRPPLSEQILLKDMVAMQDWNIFIFYNCSGLC